MRAFSGLSDVTARFPVLRFFGICNGGASLARPRSSPSCCLVAPKVDERHTISILYTSYMEEDTEKQERRQPPGHTHHGPGLHHLYGA